MPNTNLTEAAIQRMKLPSTRTDYRDAKSTGLILRVTPKGTKTWRMRYMRDGRINQMTLGHWPSMGVADARKQAQAHHDQIAIGDDPAAEIRAMPTVSEFADTYIERYAKRNKKAWAIDRRNLDNDVIPHIGKVKLDRVKRRDIVGVLDRVRDRGAATMANRVYATVRRMFAFAVERGVIEHSPASYIRADRETPRDVVMSDQSIRSFWVLTEASDADVSRSNHHLIRNALRLMLLTGCRNSEVCGIRLDELDHDKQVWTIPSNRTKNGLVHTVPLSDMALSVISDAMVYADGSHLFPSANKYGCLTNTLCAYAMARFFPDTSKVSTGRGKKYRTALISPHDLRRTCATRISGLGYNRLIVDKILNHKDNSIGGVYDRHSYDREKREALTAWANELSRVLVNDEAHQPNPS